MKNLLIVATCGLCVLIISAIPLPSGESEQTQGLEIVQIPLQGNKEIDILSLPENAEGQLTDRNKRTIGVLRELFPELSKMAASPDAENSVDLAALSERLQSINRVVRNTAAQTSGAIDPDSVTVVNNDEVKSAASDLSESKAPAIDELSLDEEETDENRNKRFLSFGFGGGNSAGGSGGSGNFLFDIIRLVGGSSGTEQTDEKENAPDDESSPKQVDGYTEGIPGPVTRLFVLANRGIANLIQDLILRIAQTSERVVNFKARLITSLI